MRFRTAAVRNEERYIRKQGIIMNETTKTHAPMNGKALYLWDITQLLLAKLHWLLLAGIIAGAGTYLAVKLFVTPIYASSVSFYVYNRIDSSSTGTINNSDLKAAKSLAATYSEILVSNSVLDSVLDDLKPQSVLSRKELDRMLTVSVVPDTQLLEVVVTSSDPKLACTIANSFAKIAQTEIVRITKAGGVEIVDRPESAAKPFAPQTLFDGLIGFIIGVMLISVVIILRTLADTTIYLPKDIEKAGSITVLGQIPDITAANDRTACWELAEGGD